MLPAGRPPRDSSNAETPLLRLFKLLDHLSLPIRQGLLVDSPALSLNPLFHYPRPAGYWNRPSHDFFEDISGFDAFSADYGGVSAC